MLEHDTVTVARSRGVLTREGSRAVGRETIPFRWDVASPELARRMGRGLRSLLPRSFQRDLVRCARDVLLAAGDSDLVFVGRSLESVHDFLRGALARTSFRDRIQLVPLSLRDPPAQIQHEQPGALDKLRAYLDAVALTPARILARPRPVAFVDLVASGETFGNLVKVLHREVGTEWRVWRDLRERLRWVCLTELGATDGRRPWYPRDSAWTREFGSEQVRDIRIDGRFWRYLGEDQPKTTDSYTVEDWGAASGRDPLEGERLEAVRQARAVFRLGECWRRRLARMLADSTRSEPWLTALGRELEA